MKTKRLWTSLPFVYPVGWHRNPKMKVDLDMLHLYLWKNTDKYGRCKLTLPQVAERVGVTMPRMKKYYVTLGEEKRIKSFGQRVLVADPGLWVFDRGILDSVDTLPGPKRRR